MLLYTKDYIYPQVNEALRREGQGSKYKPTGRDLALGPYALLLDALLFCWPELHAISTTTYRGMDLSPDDFAKYKSWHQVCLAKFCLILMG